MEYNHSEIEKRWQKEWAKNKTFAAKDNSDKPKFYSLDMFPYPSGAGLHVGHPLGYIASDLFIENLPGFPDGISQGENGLYWLAIVSPRDEGLDAIANSVFMKNVIAKMPAAMQPAAVHYGFVLGIDGNGNIVHNLQDPSSQFSENTSVQQVGNDIYIGSLYENGIAKMAIQK